MLVPVFHLHIRNGFGFAPDDEGQELASLEHARQIALQGARSLMSADVTEGMLDLRGQIEIADEQGRPVGVVPFRDAVSIVDGELPPVDGDGEAR